MPSHAPPSLHDGRPPPSSLPPGKDAAYYSNKDIELLYEVVSVGQDILPTLPRRERLPTCALFHAADRVFPKYGLDPNAEDKLTRIIFLIGGMRSTDDLRDRFRTVLARMGIELEFVPEKDGADKIDESDNEINEIDDDNEADDQSLPVSDRSRHRGHRWHSLHASPPTPHPGPPRSVRSAAPSSAALSAGGAASAYSAYSGAFPVASRVTGRRRRNSDSNAQFVDTADAHRPDHGHLDYVDEKGDDEEADSRVQHSDGSDDGVDEVGEVGEVGEVVRVVRQQPQQRRRPPQHHRRRSDSLAPPRHYEETHRDQAYEPPPSHAQQRALPTQHSPRPIDPWLSEIPSFPHAMELAGGDRDEELTGSSQHDYEDDDEDMDGEEDPSYHSGHGGEYGRHDPDVDGDDLDEYTRSLQLMRPPARQEHRDDRDDDSSAHYLYEQHHHNALALRTRPLPAQQQQQQQQQRGAPSGLAASASTEPLSLSPQSHSHLSLASGVADFFGASDTTVQEEFEVGGPLPKVDPLVMAKVADTFFWRFSFCRGLAIPAWRSLAATRHKQARYAAQMDREWSASEALLEWSDSAGIRLREGTAIIGGNAADPDAADADATDSSVTDDATALARQKDEERRRFMGWAVRVDVLQTLSSALVRWQAMAQTEAERTGVARRHLLRRKVFGAWRDQAAADDDSRVDHLAKRWALGRWANALRHARDEEADVAGPLYRQSLAIHSFCTWQRAYQARTADALRTLRPKIRAVRRWRACTAAAVGLVAAAASHDAAGLRRRAVDWWNDQLRTHMVYDLRIDESNCETHYKVALKAWTQAAFYEQRLRAFLTARAAEKKETTLALWRQGTTALQSRRQTVDRTTALDHAKHWWRVTMLSRYRAKDEHRRKTERVRDWQCAYHYASLSRDHEDRLVRTAFLRLQDAYAQSQDYRPIQAAEQLDRKHLVAGMVVSAVRDSCATRATQQQTADRMAYAATISAGLQSLAHGSARHAEMDVLARRGAYYVSVVNALDGWAAYARNVREQRLRSSYHRFRRTVVKRQAAADCVGVWRAALWKHVGGAASIENAEDGTEGYAQTVVRMQSERALETVVDTLNHWYLATEDSLFRQAVAAEADVEVYLSTWRLQHAEAAELAAAAAEHDAAVQLAGRWDDWELQAVQARARAHTAAALHEKNDRRLGRRTLGLWQQLMMERWAEKGDDDHGDDGYEYTYEDDDPDTSLRTSSYALRPRRLVPVEQQGQSLGLGPRGLLQSSTASTGSRWHPGSVAPMTSSSITSPPPLGRTIGSSNATRRQPDAATTPSYMRTTDRALGTSVRRPAASLLLHPITEYDGSQRSSVAGMSQQQKRQLQPSHTELSTPMAPPAQRGGGYGGSNSVPAPGRLLAGMTPAAVAPAGQPRRLYRSATAAAAVATATTTPAPQRSAHSPPTTAKAAYSSPRQPSLFQMGSLSAAASSYTPAATGTRVPPPLPPRHHRMQERLLSATRLADSVQLGPMSAFDEGGGGVAAYSDPDDDAYYRDGRDEVDKYEEEEEDGNVADDDDGSSPRSVRRPRLAVGWSPDVRSQQERQQQQQQQQQQRRRPSSTGQARPLPWQQRPRASPTAAAATTTTPLAPLPTPFARRLRAAYGGEGAGQRQRQRSRLAAAAEEAEKEEEAAAAAAAERFLASSPPRPTLRSPRSPRVVVLSPRVVTFAERMAEGRGEQQH